MMNPEDFFPAQRFLIVDASSPSRIAIARVLADLGLAASRVSLAGSFESAADLIRRASYTGLICEYDLGKNCGLELIDLISDLKISAVITRNRSEAAAANAAERDVDVFIPKPFTIRELKRALIRAVELKSSVANASVPMEQSIEIAQASRARAKEYDKIGYRSLMGLADALLAQRQEAEAYGVLRKLVLGFPANPRRLMQVLKLAVATKNLQDVEDYYKRFLEVEVKTPEVIKHVTAALILAGRHWIQSSDPKRGLALFKKAALTSTRDPAFLKKIVHCLLDAGMPKEADTFLTWFPASAKEKIDFIALDYLVFSLIEPLYKVIKKGRRLVQNGHHDPLIYRLLIQACQSAGHEAEAESFVLDAMRQWPESKREYEDLLHSPNL